MGNQSSHTSELDNFSSEQWVNMENSQSINRRLLVNRTNGSRFIQEHQIEINGGKQMSLAKQMYKLRKNSPYLVASKYFNVKQNDQICFGFKTAQLYTERIDLRLSDVNSIPFPDILHVYSQCLEGCEKLSYRLGCFKINDSYIGINEQFKVKVWHNRDFGASTPAQPTNEQSDMIQSIVQTIQAHTDRLTMPSRQNSFQQFLYRGNSKVNFGQFKLKLTQYVNYFNRGIIPEHLVNLKQKSNKMVLGNNIKVSNVLGVPQKPYNFLDNIIDRYPIPSQATYQNNYYGPQLNTNYKNFINGTNNMTRVRSTTAINEKNSPNYPNYSPISQRVTFNNFNGLTGRNESIGSTSRIESKSIGTTHSQVSNRPPQQLPYHQPTVTFQNRSASVSRFVPLNTYGANQLNRFYANNSKSSNYRPYPQTTPISQFSLGQSHNDITFRYNGKQGNRQIQQMSNEKANAVNIPYSMGQQLKKSQIYYKQQLQKLPEIGKPGSPTLPHEVKQNQFRDSKYSINQSISTIPLKMGKKGSSKMYSEQQQQSSVNTSFRQLCQILDHQENQQVSRQQNEKKLKPIYEKQQHQYDAKFDPEVLADFQAGVHKN